jgi:eukaryotic-like serine/threonine-protein kinase
MSPPRAATVTDATASMPRSRWSWAKPAGIATVVTALVVGAAAWALRPKPEVPRLVQFAYTLPEGQNFSNTGRQLLAISPDGTKLVYVANLRLYLRNIAELEAHPIPGTETDTGAINPVFAPDGQSIAYWSLSGPLGGLLKRIPITGGAASILASDTGAPFGASWSSDGILYGQNRPSAASGTGQSRFGIERVRANGGMPERIITVGEDEQAHGPQLLPDGHTVLFTLAKARGLDRWDHAQIVAQSLADGSRHVIIDGSDGRYLPTGHLLYAVGGTMFAVPFDARRLEKTGTPVPVVVGVRRGTAATTGSAILAVSDEGTLIYRPGPVNVASTVRSVVIGDDKGESTTLKLPLASYAHPRVSPDGRVLAIGREDGAMSDIWTYDLSGKAEAKRLTFDGINRFPVWSADSRRVTFQSNRDGDASIWWQSPDGGAAERLTKAPAGEEHIPESWSRDGARLLFSVVKAASRTRTLWVLTLNGLKIEQFGNVESVEPLGAGFSPDGKWIVYTHAASTGALQSPDRGVFVEPYPARPGEKRQAPKSNIDYHPVWSPDGTKIYYVPSLSRPTVAVPITLTPSISFGTPVELPRMPRPGLLSGDYRGYDVLRDGRVVSLSAGPDDSAQASGTEIRVKLNWFEELKRLAPVK